MKMGHSNEHDLILRRFVNNAEGEAVHLTASNRAAERMPRQWKFFDAANRFPSPVAELFAQVWKLCVVVTNDLA